MRVGFTIFAPAKPMREQPQQNINKTPSNINFGGRNGDDKFLLKTLSNIPCPCCGQIMLTLKAKEKFVQEILEQTGQQFINAMSQVLPYLKKTETIIAQQLITEAQRPKNQYLDIRGLLKKSEFPQLHSKVRSYEIVSRIKSSSALAPQEAVYKLLHPSTATTEHIIPYSLLKDPYSPYAPGDINTIYNYLAMCSECNSEKGNQSLAQWVKFHPRMIGNSQKYMDKVSSLIIDLKLIAYARYPQRVAQVLTEQSKRAINLKVQTSESLLNKTRSRTAYMDERTIQTQAAI